MFNRIIEMLSRLFFKPTEATPVKPEMRAATDLWWEIYQKNGFAASIARYVAGLVTGEVKITFSGEAADEVLQRQFVGKLGAFTERLLVGGYAVVKPYVGAEGGLDIDAAFGYNFRPLMFDGAGNITAGEFVDRVDYGGNTYFRVEKHAYDAVGGVHSVRNTCWRGRIGGDRVSLSTVPQWEHLEESGDFVTPCNLIVTFRLPNSNTVELDGKLPVSFFAGSEQWLRRLEESVEMYYGEMKRLQSKVFLDSSLMKKDENGRVNPLPDEYYIKIPADDLRASIVEYAPETREEDYRRTIQTTLSLLETSLGISSGTFAAGENGLRTRTTAAQVISEDQTTASTVRRIQAAMEPALRALGEAVDVICRVYGLAGAGEMGVEFGDGVFEDTDKEFERRLRMVQAGLMRPEGFNAWYFGVSEEQARAMLPELTGLFDA